MERGTEREVEYKRVRNAGCCCSRIECMNGSDRKARPSVLECVAGPWSTRDPRRRRPSSPCVSSCAVQYSCLSFKTVSNIPCYGYRDLGIPVVPRLDRYLLQLDLGRGIVLRGARRPASRACHPSHTTRLSVPPVLPVISNHLLRNSCLRFASPFVRIPWLAKYVPYFCTAPTSSIHF